MCRFIYLSTPLNKHPEVYTVGARLSYLQDDQFSLTCSLTRTWKDVFWINWLLFRKGLSGIVDNFQKCSFRNIREMNFRSVNHIAVHFHRLIYICNVLNFASGHSGLLNKLINVMILIFFILFLKRKMAVFVHFYKVSLNYSIISIPKQFDIFLSRKLF